MAYHKKRGGHSLWYMLCAICYLLVSLSSLPIQAEPILKIINGRVKEISLRKQKLVLSYRHPVSGEVEELAFKVDEGTGFGKGSRLEDFKEGDPVSVDYEENPSQIPRAVRVKRIDVSGVPDEIAQFRR